MIQYHVRSRYLVDIVNDINEGKLILSPYFQRKLVWRLAHKVDFIKTILLGYPFPEIFLSRGKIDLDTMTSRSSIVDGQQRMNSICEFIDGKFSVEEKNFNELSAPEKESFLKYEIAIIDLDLADDDQKIVDIFQRLNRTFYALSDIEKMATEFASSEFMLVAKLLCGEITRASEGEASFDETTHKYNPNITRDFMDWANEKDVSCIRHFLLERSIFNPYEISRNVHLRFTLNLMATRVVGYYNRNEQLKDLLEQYAQSFPQRDEITATLNNAAALVLKLKLKNSSFWCGKSTAFSLISLFAERYDTYKKADIKKIRAGLEHFSKKPTPDYLLAAKEAVNNKKERLLRRNKLEQVILEVL
ncbi:MAG: DUF262 domain-containing protein [Limisphaerales bacterium]